RGRCCEAATRRASSPRRSFSCSRCTSHASCDNGRRTRPANTQPVCDMKQDAWPALGDWAPTYATLHRWAQIVGKTRLGLAPFENHWWNCTLYVTTRGLTTSTMPYRSGGGGGVVEVEFDFLDDALLARTDGGETRSLRLE